jgi:hypothetical protein
LRRAAAFAFAALVALLLAACGGDRAPEAEPTSAGPSGIQAVDAVIEGVLSGEASALRPLVRLRPTECVGPADASLGAFFCGPGESAGDVIDVLPVAECQSHYVRAADLDQVLEFRPGTELYAVYAMDEGAYGVVFSQRAVEDGPLFGLTVGIEFGAITYIDYGCGQSPERMVENVDQERFVVPPPDGG